MIVPGHSLLGFANREPDRVFGVGQQASKNLEADFRRDLKECNCHKGEIGGGTEQY